MQLTWHLSDYLSNWLTLSLYLSSCLSVSLAHCLPDVVFVIVAVGRFQPVSEVGFSYFFAFARVSLLYGQLMLFLSVSLGQDLFDCYWKSRSANTHTHAIVESFYKSWQQPWAKLSLKVAANVASTRI